MICPKCLGNHPFGQCPEEAFIKMHRDRIETDKRFSDQRDKDEHEQERQRQLAIGKRKETERFLEEWSTPSPSTKKDSGNGDDNVADAIGYVFLKAFQIPFRAFRQIMDGGKSGVIPNIKAGTATALLWGGIGTVVAHNLPEQPKPQIQPKVTTTAPKPVLSPDPREIPSGLYVTSFAEVAFYEQDRVTDKVGRQKAILAENSCVEPYTVDEMTGNPLRYGYALVTARVEGHPGIQTGFVRTRNLEPSPAAMKPVDCKAKFLDYTP